MKTSINSRRKPYIWGNVISAQVLLFLYSNPHPSDVGKTPQRHSRDKSDCQMLHSVGQNILHVHHTVPPAYWSTREWRLGVPRGDAISCYNPPAGSLQLRAANYLQTSLPTSKKRDVAKREGVSESGMRRQATRPQSITGMADKEGKTLQNQFRLIAYQIPRSPNVSLHSPYLGQRYALSMPLSIPQHVQVLKRPPAIGLQDPSRPQRLSSGSK
jgi:hypothetical protein